MMSMFRALLLATAIAYSPAVLAQDTQGQVEPPVDAPLPDDPSLQTVPPAELSATPQDAEIAVLRAQIEAVQGQLDEMKKQLVKTTPVWKGAPQFVDAEDGWAFKVRGRLQVDTGLPGKPDNFVANRNLGEWTTRVRRARLGVEGSIPGGFGYKAEADFANSSVGFGDVVLSYAPTDAPFAITVGNQESLDGMEQITSSRWSSFIERAQANDAFVNTRRLGVVGGYHSKDNLFRIDAGLFTAHAIDASLDNDGWIGALRSTYTPFALGGFLHLGASYQHREFQSNDNATTSTSVGAPSTNQFARYRARPFLQLTDVRFVDTGNIAARSDDILGAELYGVFKSLHLGGEAQWLRVNTYRPGDVATGLNAFAGDSGVTPADDPTFFSAFAEAGYFLTGETRGYKNGLWDRTKVLNPVGKGGSGAFQLIGRFDYLDLNSRKLFDATTTTFSTGATALAPLDTRLARGGRQLGYLAGLTWIPVDYVRFMLNYIHADVTGGPLQATVNPGSTEPINKRSFSTDSVALRAQIDW